MKRLIVYSILGFLIFQTGLSDLYGQARLIRRIQQEAEKKAIEEIFGKEEETKSAADEAGTRTGRNRRGGGLDQEIPDVNKYIAEAGKSFSEKNYTGARSSLRQALWGVELEMGQGVLAILPEKAGPVAYKPDADRVSSTGIGFAGLLIERYYSGPDDLELSLSIGNDSALLGLANLALTAGYYQSATDQENQKQIRFKELNAYIRYDDDSGYTLSVPFGQSSIFLLQGINYGSESDFMAAANQFDIQAVKQKLGAQ
jgi:hypothetical protein